MSVYKRFFVIESNDKDTFEMGVDDALNQPKTVLVKCGQQDYVADERIYTSYWAHFVQEREK